MQTFNSFNELANAQHAAPLQSQMSVFNGKQDGFSIRWYNSGNYGKIAGSIVRDGKVIGKVGLNTPGNAMIVTLDGNSKPVEYPVDRSLVIDEEKLERQLSDYWNTKGIKQAGKEAVASVLAQQGASS